MQELEKILEELKRIKDGNRKEKLYAKYPPNSKDQEVLNAYSQGYEDGTDNFYNAAVGIIRKHMNDGWISVEDKLPKRTLDEKINNLYKKYLVFIDSVDGWDIDMAVYDFWNDKKWRTAHDGYEEIENVVAWRPLPEPYRPERSEGE